MLDDQRTMAIVFGNLGGLGALAWCLLHLHKDALKVFREELKEERASHIQAISKLINKIDSFGEKIIELSETIVEMKAWYQKRPEP